MVIFMKCNFCNCENEFNVCDECFERIIKLHILQTDQELIRKNNGLVIINILMYISLFAIFIFPPSVILFIIFLIISRKKNKNIGNKLQEKYEISKWQYTRDHEIFDPNYNF